MEETALQELTLAEKATNNSTWTHINRVRFYMNRVIRDLMDRAEAHDQSKLRHPEVEAFTRVEGRLAGLDYGSPAYSAALKDLGPALQHHYKNNDHHPEHFGRGIEDMNLIQLTEMLCDWKAASERHDNGNIFDSITYNRERYGIPDPIVVILRNTAMHLFGVSGATVKKEDS